MNWKKIVLPPVAIYAVIFLFISALIGAKVPTGGVWITIVNFIITIVGLYLATNYAKPKNMQNGLVYGLIWLVMFVVLDLILTRPFAGWGYFTSWKTWVVYALTILMPTFLPKK